VLPTARRNLRLSASVVSDRHGTLLQMLSPGCVCVCVCGVCACVCVWRVCVLKCDRSGTLEHAASVIVYCTMKHVVDDVVSQLAMQGIDVAPYHTDRTAAERARVQTRFLVSGYCDA
jgi:superfamily II DNA helicase RecQ